MQDIIDRTLEEKKARLDLIDVFIKELVPLMRKHNVMFSCRAPDFMFGPQDDFVITEVRSAEAALVSGPVFKTISFELTEKKKTEKTDSKSDSGRQGLAQFAPSTLDSILRRATDEPEKEDKPH